jgi:hypothetical protein
MRKSLLGKILNLFTTLSNFWKGFRWRGWSLRLPIIFALFDLWLFFFNYLLNSALSNLL